ncbi:DUF423 domain-containing protein [Aegicerativicinus sediminis]|uniref:DUF423 domain-containing protein n=1 Tax=Aegicerativicinus sediminis TaxID=2893202 RepID=UPI001E4525FC|nr:DUF423 domain-containing protein [Aegicerativicinus sediminis]
MSKQILISGISIGVLAVILGAFGAHGLKELVSPENIATFETGVRYQMYHGLFLLFLSQLGSISPKIVKISYWLVVFGLIFFSGSIYGLATNILTSFDFKTIAFITPIGGLLLIVAWVILLFGISSKEH